MSEISVNIVTEYNIGDVPTRSNSIPLIPKFQSNGRLVKSAIYMLDPLFEDGLKMPLDPFFVKWYTRCDSGTASHGPKTEMMSCLRAGSSSSI